MSCSRSQHTDAGFEPSTSVSRNRHSNHVTNMLKTKICLLYQRYLSLVQISTPNSDVGHTMPHYYILGATLKRVTDHDYLGLTISSDLNWLRHVAKNSNKASGTLGLLKRTLSPCSQNVKSIAYKMLVRPQLEYASEVWRPYTMNCIKKIEQIQRNSCRFIFHE